MTHECTANPREPVLCALLAGDSGDGDAADAGWGLSGPGVVRLRSTTFPTDQQAKLQPASGKLKAAAFLAQSRALLQLERLDAPPHALSSPLPHNRPRDVRMHVLPRVPLQG